jgi:hypothetical protein
VTTPTFLDLVPEQDPLLFPRKRNRKGEIVNTSQTEWLRDAAGHRVERTVVRDPSAIVGVGFHQTACVFGPSDPEQRHRRALRIPAHVTAFRDGTYVRAAPLLWFLYHGNALNPFTVGLECEGHYPGRADDLSTPRREDEESTWGDDPTPMTPLALATFRAAAAYLVNEAIELGCPIQYAWAHRQSAADRRSDPGYEIWGQVVEGFVVPLFNLKVEYERTWRDGRPIPKAWSKGAAAPY